MLFYSMVVLKSIRKNELFNYIYINRANRITFTNAKVAGDLEVTGTLKVTSNTTISGNLIVSGSNNIYNGGGGGGGDFVKETFFSSREFSSVYNVLTTFEEKTNSQTNAGLTLSQGTLLVTEWDGSQACQINIGTLDKGQAILIHAKEDFDGGQNITFRLSSGQTFESGKLGFREGGQGNLGIYINPLGAIPTIGGLKHPLEAKMFGTDGVLQNTNFYIKTVNNTHNSLVINATPTTNLTAKGSKFVFLGLGNNKVSLGLEAGTLGSGIINTTYETRTL